MALRYQEGSMYSVEGVSKHGPDLSMGCSAHAYPAALRTVIGANETLLTASWPHLVFLIWEHYLRFNSLWVLGSRSLVVSKDSLVCPIFVPNGSPQVCLGTADDDVRDGSLHPVDAYWNTAFPRWGKTQVPRVLFYESTSVGFLPSAPFTTLESRISEWVRPCGT